MKPVDIVLNFEVLLSDNSDKVFSLAICNVSVGKPASIN